MTESERQEIRKKYKLIEGACRLTRAEEADLRYSERISDKIDEIHKDKRMQALDEYIEQLEAENR